MKIAYLILLSIMAASCHVKKPAQGHGTVGECPVNQRPLPFISTGTTTPTLSLSPGLMGGGSVDTTKFKYYNGFEWVSPVIIKFKNK